MPRAVWNGVVVADSEDVEVVDGYTYFPAGAVNAEHLRRSDHSSSCPWKGTASYFDVVVGEQVNRDAAWEYPHPSDRAAPLVGGRIGFWRGVRIESDAGPARPGLVARFAGRKQ
ncbi:MAG: DUF427 domain-containing protein [Dehalococcoidia bacterium]